MREGEAVEWLTHRSQRSSVILSERDEVLNPPSLRVLLPCMTSDFPLVH